MLNVGWPEIVVLALLALFIFGPERLPHLAKDAAQGLKKVREAMTGVQTQVNESLGDDLPELRNLDLRKYHPRTFLRDQLFGDDEPAPHVPSGATAVGAADAMARARGRDRGTPPPFDLDAT